LSFQKYIKKYLISITQSDSFTQHDIEHQIASEYSQDDRAYTEVAINIALDHREELNTDVDWKKIVRPATQDQMEEYVKLEKLIKVITKNRMLNDRKAKIETQPSSSQSLVEESASVTIIPVDTELYAHTDVLNEEQKCVHNIVTSHLRATLENGHPPQMLMIMRGTGKPTLLNAIPTTFEKNNAQHLLKKTTMSGVAASLVGGMTLHWLAGLPARSVPQSDIWPDNLGKDIKDRRILNLLLPLWIAIDEAGMCTVDMIILLSQVAGKV
jgi:hypothetical protein